MLAWSTTTAKDRSVPFKSLSRCCKKASKSAQSHQWWSSLTNTSKLRTHLRKASRAYSESSCILKTWDWRLLRSRRDLSKLQEHLELADRHPLSSHQQQRTQLRSKSCGSLKCGSGLRWLSFWRTWSRRRLRRSRRWPAIGKWKRLSESRYSMKAYRKSPRLKAKSDKRQLISKDVKNASSN